jgi:tRNA(Ile)-lysidine synthase
MRERLLKYIKEKKLFKNEEKLLVAVSGGADSVALCYFLSEIGTPFLIAHCNFKLRGVESDEDEQFVRQLAHQLGKEVVVKSFETLQATKDKKISIQMAARELRYQWFEELRSKHKCKYIATAHHKSDSAETILLNITRGTGIEGLHGIKPKNGNIIRPLLIFSKEEILSFLQENKITFRDDSSNSSDKYHRNRIRLNVIPQLKKINPALEEAFETFIEKMNQVEDIFRKEVDGFKANRVSRIEDRIIIDVVDLKEVQGAPIILFEVLKEYGFNYSQCKDICQKTDGPSGKKFESEGFTAFIDRNSIILSPRAIEDKIYSLIEQHKTILPVSDFVLHLHKIKKEDMVFSQDRAVALLDFDKLSFPLTLREWNEGDFFIPLGMKGKKKLSDYFIDQKIPLPEKGKKLVLLSEEKIVWVVGERIDDRYKITASTQQVFQITIER